jgi:hypothetical protein
LTEIRNNKRNDDSSHSLWTAKKMVANVAKRNPMIIEEEDSEAADDPSFDDVIPGPANPGVRVTVERADMSTSQGIDNTISCKRGTGVLASAKDLAIPAQEFAEGCKLLQQAAIGDQEEVERLLKENPRHVNFRDYDRRTALHVAASEGHLKICQYLIKNGAKMNRSDRWGGSALDDANRHRHHDVIAFLRLHGATPGSANQLTNLIRAAADGDLNEVQMLLTMAGLNVNEGDYDGRTALHLAAGEGHLEIIELLCMTGANANAADRWGGRPLDDAQRSRHTECINVLKKFGAEKGTHMGTVLGDSSSIRREMANLEVDFAELEMVDRIGAGAQVLYCVMRSLQYCPFSHLLTLFVFSDFLFIRRIW